MSTFSSHTNTSLAIFKTLHHYLKTHTSLNSDDILDAASHIYHLYLNKNISIDSIGIFLSLLNRCGIGKFALVFNQELDYVILNSDWDLLTSLLHESLPFLFPEVYDNSYLSDDDVDFMDRLFYREFNSMLRILDSVQNNLLDLSSTPLCCDQKMDTLTSQCYGDICIADSKTPIDGMMSQYENVYSNVYTVDRSKLSLQPQIYCFDIFELLESMTHDIPINPQTNLPFTSYAINLINQRFRKEIAMYLRYKELINE